MPLSFFADKLLSDHGVDFLQQSVHIHAVHGASLLNGLTAGSGAAQAVHADGHEYGSGLRSDVEDVADDGVFGNLSHNGKPPIVFLFRDVDIIPYLTTIFN